MGSTCALGLKQTKAPTRPGRRFCFAKANRPWQTSLLFRPSGRGARGRHTRAHRGRVPPRHRGARECRTRERCGHGRQRGARGRRIRARRGRARARRRGARVTLVRVVGVCHNVYLLSH